ncbi:uncharacterized protein [Heterodontus francisci]|uniref:uncharacterized protein isoform X2 n=1 Tax=Heterodontus francisci TaxID=7792 RepID=UPI00355C8D5D
MTCAKKKMVDFVRHEVPQVQNFIKSGNQFLKEVQKLIANSVREGKLSQHRGRAYFKEVVEIVGPRANEVLNCLMARNDKMIVELAESKSSKCGNAFVSTVISYCYFWDADVRRQTTGNYFGASVSCKGRQQKEIMIDILCHHTWHRAIGLAVCVGNWYNKQAFRFPSTVHCRAYKINPPVAANTPDSQHNLRSGVEMSNSLEISRSLNQRISLIPRAPYETCNDLLTDINYDLIPIGHKHPYCEFGTSAECESLSQLLYANRQIVERLEYLSEQIDCRTLINSKLERLKENLKSLCSDVLEFNVGRHFEFYDPAEGITALERCQR